VIVAPFFGSDSGIIRQQPWTKTTYSKELEQFAGQYYDFRAKPELIETALEDFAPYADRPAIQRFYRLLRWINTDPDSSLETTDCAFQAPRPTEEGSLFDFRLQCDGRLEFFHRNFEVNTSPETFYRLVCSFCVFLQLENQNFSAGIVEVSHATTHFINAPPEMQRGARVCARFISYGNTDAQAFGNLKSVFENLAGAFLRLSKAWPVNQSTTAQH
jgi:hypothetical protein